MLRIILQAKQRLRNLRSAKRRQQIEPQALAGLAAVAEGRGKWPEARTLLDAALKALPDTPETRTARAQTLQRIARVMFSQKDTQGSLEKLREAYRLDPSSVPAPEAALGCIHEWAGDRENAKKWMAAAVARAPEDVRVRLAVTQWALLSGQVAEARQHADKAVQFAAAQRGYMLHAEVLAGVVALFEKDYAAAEKNFEKGHLLSPGSFAASNNLALALCEQKDESGAKKRRALEYALNNSRQFPDNAEAASTLGRVYYSMGDLDEAERALLRSVGSGKVSPDTAYYLACLLEDRDRKDDAKKALEAAIKEKSFFSMLPDALALLTSLDPQSPEAFHAGDTVVVMAAKTVLSDAPAATASLPVGTKLKVREVHGEMLRVEADGARQGTVPCNAVVKQRP